MEMLRAETWPPARAWCAVLVASLAVGCTQGGGGSQAPPGGGSAGAPASVALAGPLPWHFGGANQARIFTQHSLAPENGVAVNATAQVEAMRRAGLRVLRIFLGQETQVPWEKPPATYTFERPLGVYHDGSLDAIDRLMVACVGDPDDPFDDVRLCIALFNHIEGTPAGDVEETLYFGTFGEVGFYRDAAARQAFKARIAHVLQHKNPYLQNRAWKDLPIVAIWEPMNEPGVHTKSDQNRTDAALLADWLGDMATTIKSLDGDGTLVSTGTTGYSRYYASGTEDFGDDLADLIAAAGAGGIPDVDIYCLHFYGGDLPTWLADARRVLPPGKRLWVEEFGDTRAASFPVAYDRGTALGTLGILERERASWAFWRLGVRKGGSSWCRFTWDTGEWASLETVARAQQAVLESFDQTPWSVRPTRNDGSAAQVSSVASDRRGAALRYVLPEAGAELRLALPAPADLTGGALTFRARVRGASGPVRIALQLKDGFGRYTRPNPEVSLDGTWRYLQIPVAQFGPGTGYDPAKTAAIVLWPDAATPAGVALELDDVRAW